MDPKYFSLEVSPKVKTIRLGEPFTTAITIKIKKAFFNHYGTNRIDLYLSIDQKDYLIEGFSVDSNIHEFRQESRIYSKNGLQTREIKLLTRKGKFITETKQSINLDTSIVMKKSVIVAAMLGILLILASASVLYFWTSISIFAILGTTIIVAPIPKRTDKNLQPLNEFIKKGTVTEERVRNLFSRVQETYNNILNEKESFAEFVDKTTKGIQLQINTVLKHIKEQDETLRSIKSDISRFEISYKNIEINSRKIKELEQSQASSLEKLANRVNKKIKGLSDSFRNALNQVSSEFKDESNNNEAILERFKEEIVTSRQNVNTLEEKIRELAAGFEKENVDILVQFENLKKEIQQFTKKSMQISDKDRKLLESLSSTENVLKRIETRYVNTDSRVTKLERLIKESLDAFEKYRSSKTPVEKIFNLEQNVNTFIASFSRSLKEIDNKLNQFLEGIQEKTKGDKKLTSTEISTLLTKTSTKISDLENRFSEQITPLAKIIEQLKDTPATPSIDQFVTIERFEEHNKSFRIDLAELEKTLTNTQKQLVEEINRLSQKIADMTNVFLAKDSRSSPVSEDSQDMQNINKFLDSLREQL